MECAALSGTPAIEVIERVAEVVHMVFVLALRDDLK
jgi:hypothetical protein